MKTLLFKALAVFFILIVCTSVMMDIFQTDFGTVDFFQKHNIFFLVFITIFPRLTLLFSSVAFGGFFWWLGFFICPRILVASLATVAYFHTNPILVVISWIVALGGETMEKAKINSGTQGFVIRTYRSPGPGAPPRERTLDKDGVIEAEFTKE